MTPSAGAASDASPDERPGAAADRGGRWRRVPPAALALAACLLAVLLVHGRALAFPFVLDDRPLIAGNAFLHSVSNPLQFFVSDYSRGADLGTGYFRPLTILSFWIQGHAAGWNPAPFHLVNLLLHALAAWAVYLAACALGCRRSAALVGALLFAVYPPNHEPAAWIAGRGDILAALFCLLGWRITLVPWGGDAAGRMTLADGVPLAAPLGAAASLGEDGARPVEAGRPWRAATGVFAFGLLAMLGKENAVTYAALVPLTALFFAASRRRRAGADGRRLVPRTTTLLLCAAAVFALAVYAVLRASAIGTLAPQPREFASGMNPLAHLAQPQRTWAGLYLTGRLLRAFVWPAPLSAALDLGPGHSFPLTGALDARVLLPAFALTGLVAMTILLWRRGSLFALPAVFVLLNLLPVSNLAVVTGGFISERFLYMPSAGLAIALAIAWDIAERWIASRDGATTRPHPARESRAVPPASTVRAAPAVHAAPAARIGVTIAAALVVLLPCALAAAARVEDWSSDESIYRAWSERFPATPMFRNGLGMVAAANGHLDAARAAFEASLTLDPRNPRTYYYLGSVLARQGRPQEAAAAMEHAAALAPDDPDIRAGRAESLLAAGRNDDAARAFAAMIRDAPADPSLRHRLLLALTRGGRWTEAEAAAREASRLFPEAPLFDVWRARIAVHDGRMDEARALLATARSKPGRFADWLRTVDDNQALKENPGPLHVDGGN